MQTAVTWEALAARHDLFSVDIAALLGADLGRLPWSLRILFENVVRNGDAVVVEQVRGITAEWMQAAQGSAEVEFHPPRLLMHDTTCVPAIVDIAGMRQYLSEHGVDPCLLNPTIAVDVSVDHSIAVDHFATANAAQMNLMRELDRNRERFQLLKWAGNSIAGLKVHPPGTGILHTINMEQLATVVATGVRGGRRWAFPDALIGTDSHTPMINGLGVLGWGVGGLEAESVLFGIPISIRVPDVIGVRLTGALRDGCLATDIALTVTDVLRRYGISGQFVEFFGPGVSSLSAGERCTIANMAPEYGATTAYFPIDDRTLEYLQATGREASHIALVREYARHHRLWFEASDEPLYTDVIELNLSQIAPSIAGPRRPQDRLAPADAMASLAPSIEKRSNGRSADDNTEAADGVVAIAAITSCTNTSDPRMIIAAGLLARKARKLGLKPSAWVKTSLSPGSPTAQRYLERAGLLKDLEALGFGIVGYGCMTCIGNSGPLTSEMDQAINHGTTAVAVLSGNRNFPGRVHPQIDHAFLASPPLVIAYALAGDIKRDILTEPIGSSANGDSVRLADIWPTNTEVDAILADALSSSDYAEEFGAASDNATWASIEAPAAPLFPWNNSSTYIRRSPFTERLQRSSLGQYCAYPLLVLGDDVTTDEISPAGAIPSSSEAGRYLVEAGQNPRDLNVFASRRGNWEAMVRGLFTSRTTKNLLEPSARPGETVHIPTGEIMPLLQAAELYRSQAHSVVVLAGARYGAGSSRDWAAKGLGLLGVRAVLAESFERIHRQNLIGMGILPLEVPRMFAPSNLLVVRGDVFEISALPEALSARSAVKTSLRRVTGEIVEIPAIAAVETQLELELLKSGGIIPHILRQHTSAVT